MFGVDNTFLSRVVDGTSSSPTRRPGSTPCPTSCGRWSRRRGHARRLRRRVHQLRPGGWSETGPRPARRPPGAHRRPQYRDLLVVENPATSSPGLAFLLATVAEFGEDGWADYWSALRDNGVEVVDDWDQAYYERFSGASDGDRPLVVSYGSSPPAEVVFADPPIDEPTTSASSSRRASARSSSPACCAGPTPPTRPASWSTSSSRRPSRQEVALNLFVYPANGDVALPDGDHRPRRRPAPIRQRSTRPPSTPTARPGSTSGPTSSCAEPEPAAAVADRRPARHSDRCSWSSSTPGRSSPCSPAGSRRRPSRRHVRRAPRRGTSCGSRCGRPWPARS